VLTQAAGGSAERRVRQYLRWAAVGLSWTCSCAEQLAREQACKSHENLSITWKNVLIKCDLVTLHI